MNPSNLSKYLELLKNFENAASEKPGTRKTFMEVSGYPHYENVVSNILAFFFDTEEEHGFRDLWLASLLAVALPGGDFEGECTEDVEREAITAKGNRLDLLITTTHYAIGIENKVFATLYNDLTDYKGLIDSKTGECDYQPICIVLSLSDQGECGEDFVNVTYASLFAEVRSRIGQYMDGADNTWLAYMKDFIRTIENLGGNGMDDGVSKFISENYKATDNFFMVLHKWRQSIKSRLKSLEEMVQISSDGKSFVYQESDGIYTCLAVDFEPPSGHPLALENGEVRLRVETGFTEDGWIVFLWCWENKIEGAKEIGKLLDDAGIRHRKKDGIDGWVLEKTHGPEATDDQVLELVQYGIDCARKILLSFDNDSVPAHSSRSALD